MLALAKANDAIPSNIASHKADRRFNYAYAGTEFGQDCYYGANLQHQSSRVIDLECNVLR
ncbi:hypothetical protein CC78DRAFT_530834 [Lojkania enalia]|uniref:Uncharacterized protein n=1 Tax=Lojkania enalia TaxID=147567 RepID=A0A9P4KIX4_9PLEO|nr:hypothetical protein CC78DRAFT_530834 [Didymosphaeria enalia]